MADLTPIPIPARQRLIEARMRLAPLVVFLTAIAILAGLWKNYVAAPTMTGQAEAAQASVGAYAPGMLAQLSVSRYQSVKAGDVIGEVTITDPRVAASALTVIQAEIEMLRTAHPKNPEASGAEDADQALLDSLLARSKLATARINLQLAESDFQRVSGLFSQKIVSQAAYDQAKTSNDQWEKQVAELGSAAGAGAGAVTGDESGSLSFSNVPASSSLRSAIALEDSKLRLAEAQMSPIELKAPVDGMVTAVHHRSGEAVIAGEPVVTISLATSARIVGYLRPPLTSEPKVGMRVEVRTRGGKREVGLAEIMEVGAQLEPIAAALQPAMKLSGNELGLPVMVSLPSNLKIRPGELVDLTLPLL